MFILEWLVAKPLFIIPITLSAVGMCLLFIARVKYQSRKGKLFTIITFDKIADDFSELERKMVFYGLFLGFMGVVSFVALIFIYG